MYGVMEFFWTSKSGGSQHTRSSSGSNVGVDCPHARLEGEHPAEVEGAGQSDLRIGLCLRTRPGRLELARASSS